MKKNRGYARKLRAENAGLKHKLDTLQVLLDSRREIFAAEQQRYHAIRGRIARLDSCVIVDPINREGYHPTLDELRRKFLMDNIKSNDSYLIQAVKVESDDTFCGIGSRLFLSIEFLAPETC